MNDERRVVKKAAQLVALATELGNEGLVGEADRPRPTDWARSSRDVALDEWEDLRRWLERLRARFPYLTRIPECWWRHNDLVEVLVALRDYERACYSPSAPATAPVDWHRALRDMEQRMELWIKRFPCGVTGRGHEPRVTATSAPPEGWSSQVASATDRPNPGIEREA